VGGWGMTPSKNKMSIENLKTSQNICIFFIVKCSIYSRIEHFFNVAKNLQPGLHYGHLNKDVLSKQIGAIFAQ